MTVTHQATGRRKEITVDSRLSGKREAKEIKDLVAKAEHMKLLDQAEENIILSENRLIALCKKNIFDAQSKPAEKELLAKVESALDYIKDYSNSHESKTASLYDEILESSNKASNSVFTVRSSHILRMDKMTPIHLIREGYGYLQSSSEDNMTWSCLERHTI